MNHDRAQNILSGQSNLARRVFAAVPKQDFWSVRQISDEMKRLEAHNLSQGEITGCLRSLVDAGLVMEAGMLTFRSNVKPPKEVLTVAKAQTATVAPKLTLLEKMAVKAQALRELANDLDDLAIEVDQHLTTQQGDSLKLKQLQETLRGLMGNG